MIDKLLSQISKMPLIAILRGITPGEAVAVSDTLVKAGFVFMEVTLNSPEWEESLNLIHKRHGNNIVLGAGTVLHPEDVDRVKKAGGQAIISPNMNVDVIHLTKELGMISAPGCYTPTECFTALEAGADILKIFPADTLGISFIKAISAVLPKGTKLCPTGGVTKGNMKDFFSVGIHAAGMGSALYKPGKSLTEIAGSADDFVKKYKKITR